MDSNALTPQDAIDKLERGQLLADSKMAALEARVESVVGAVEKLTAEWRASKQTNWPVLIGIAIPIIGVISAGFVAWQSIIDLKNEVKLAPVLAQNSVSSMDRQRLNSEVTDLQRETGAMKAIVSANSAHMQEQTARLDRLRETGEATRSSLESFQAESKAKGVEIETQFRASDHRRNTEWAETYRYIGLLWQKTFPGTTFPEFSALSTIAQPNAVK